VTDKTGTLTKNEMYFYGIVDSNGNEFVFPSDALEDFEHRLGHHKSSSEADNGKQKIFRVTPGGTEVPQYQSVQQVQKDANRVNFLMWFALSVCHSCKRNPEDSTLNSASPEELALVDAALKYSKIT
jgi:magnesium-transporting ATPase (P-type)